MNRVKVFFASFALIAGSAMVPAPAFAAPTTTPSGQAACEAQGYVWSRAQGCANKKCSVGGKKYEPGSTRQITRRGQPSGEWYYCDGFTGKWVHV